MKAMRAMATPLTTWSSRAMAGVRIALAYGPQATPKNR
jgi:hypothetical protein